MQMDLLIRKHVLTEKHNSYYFKEFVHLLESDLENDVVSLLFTFFEDSQELWKQMKPLIAKEEAYPPLVIKENDSSLFGYTSLGFIDVQIYKDRMEKNEAHQKLMDTTHQLWTALNWTMSDFKTIKITVGEFDKETAMYNGYPTTFEEIHKLWNNN